MSDSLPDTSTFACNLNTLSTEERARHGEVCQRLFGSVGEVRELPNGYGFRWDLPTWMLAAEFVTRERLCCPFFDFALALDSGSEVFWLNITGKPGVKDFVKVEFGETVVTPDAALARE